MAGNENPQVWTKKAVASFIQVSERTVDRWRAQGRLKAFKVGQTVRFYREHVEQFLQKMLER